MKFLNFDTTELCLDLELDSRYDLILGLAWIEHHEPLIDWRFNTLGAMRNVPSEALEIHEPTFGRQQMHYWREPLTEDANVLDIGMSELINSNVNDMNIERISFAVFKESYTPLSDTSCDNDSLHAPSMVGLGPSHKGSDSHDASAVAREITQSEDGRDGTSLNVDKNVFGKQPEHSGQGSHSSSEVVYVNPLGEVFELHNSPPDIARDMSSRIERAKTSSNYRKPTFFDLKEE